MEVLITSVIVIKLLVLTQASEIIRIVLLTESSQPEVIGWFNDSIKDITSSSPDFANLQGRIVSLVRDDEEQSYQNLCKCLSEGVSVILDSTWSPWSQALGLSDHLNIPIVSTALGDSTTVLDGLLQFLYARRSVDIVIIFEKDKDLEQALYRVLGSTVLRLLVMTSVDEKIKKLKDLKPIPSYIVIMGRTSFLEDTYKMTVREGLVIRSDRWILCATDLRAHKLDTSIINDKSVLIRMTLATFCLLQGQGEDCNDDDSQFKIELSLMNLIIRQLVDTFYETNIQSQLIKSDCSDNQVYSNETVKTIKPTRRFYDKLVARLSNNGSLLYWYKKRRGLYHRAELVVQVINSRSLRTVAKWYSDKPVPYINMSVPRRFFTIGITPSIPWTYPTLNKKTGAPILSSTGHLVYEGYCIDLISKLADIMDFDYEIITPKSGGFGKKFPNGTWNGLIGDLVDGTIDFAVGALVMTSQREEVVDFIAPYFEQSGFTIVIRKPSRKTSLFKFMTVLRVEVWLSIVAALTMTAILLTVLDKYSPYSAKNSRETYPYPCREFTLKESLWFALTSFTPQGGGEAPKSLSGRTLVAAYWLFVVLMLATFTANLAAFLTVERLQSPVSSLEQLARQSRINYTVVEGGPAHNYFMNMKNAEDILYRVWKEITLNASSDELQYQVWDYPIREQYGHILLSINASQPLPTAAHGFNKVDESEDSNFAFIHDSAEIKYEITKNCNLTMVGEIFGERPYAIAIQQGSRIQEEVSQALLLMQKTRFLDDLVAKYWNNTCPDSDDSEGITLDSLGGVFIATLFGLALAMITLIWEIFYYKRKDRMKNEVKRPSDGTSKTKSLLKDVVKKIKKDKRKKNKHLKTITIGDTFKPVLVRKPNVEIIRVEPRYEYNP